MMHSLNEIEALSKRAARGAGLSWGMSEEAAKSVRWLASYELPGVKLLADVLVQNENALHDQVAPKSLDGVWRAASGTLCPLVSGAALNDCANRLERDQTIEMANVSHPLLIVPFAAWAALYAKSAVSMAWLDVRVDTDGYRLWIDDPQKKIATTIPVSLTCRRATHRDDPSIQPLQRGNVCPSTWSRLSSLAHRTYAPATNESRLLGAGAGVSDND